MEGPEWDAQTYITEKTGSGAEAAAISSGGVEGGHYQGFQRLWVTPGDGGLLQIPGTGDLSDRWKLDGSGKEILPGEGGME